MSMDNPSATSDIRDIDMSEAASDDPELALGEFSLFHIFPLFRLSRAMSTKCLSSLHLAFFFNGVSIENSSKHYLTIL